MGSGYIACVGYSRMQIPLEAQKSSIQICLFYVLNGIFSILVSTAAKRNRGPWSAPGDKLLGKIINTAFFVVMD